MHSSFRHLPIFLLSASPALALYLGPTYPFPTDLTSNASFVRHAWQNLSQTFDAYLQQGKNTSTASSLTGVKDVTFSTSLFSLEDPSTTELQYHYTAPQIAHSKIGTKQVNANSIYRIASISKLITVFTGLLELSLEDWNKPLTDVLPDLAAAKSDVYAPQWNQITPWALAQQISGIPALGAIGDLLLTYAEVAYKQNTSVEVLETKTGFPPVNPTVLGPCALVACTDQQFEESASSPSPVFQPFFTPGYSDLGLMLLGMVISRTTGKDYSTLYSDAVFSRLGMDSSFANAPISGPLLKNSVIAGPLNSSWVFPTNNPTIPSGGLLSTINDLNKLGTGILNSTLLSPVRTRQWMKPHSHTASFSYSVGAPWEIVRYVSPTTSKITDIYTKLGDSGAYGGMLALIPDYNAGFSFLNAWYQSPGEPQTRGEIALEIINTIAETVLPALEAQAAKEARANFVGTYVSNSSTAAKSSLTVAFNASNIPTSNLGLTLHSWTSNGTDMIKVQFSGTKPQMLLSMPRGGDIVTFQLGLHPQWDSYQQAGMGPFTGFYDSNFDWFTYDGSRYDGGSLSTFRFTVDEEGKAVSVYNPATKETLVRK